MTILFEDCVLPGGKHKGKTVKQVAESEPGYIRSFNNASGNPSNKWRKNLCIADELLNSLFKYSPIYQQHCVAIS